MKGRSECSGCGSVFEVDLDALRLSENVCPKCGKVANSTMAGDLPTYVTEEPVPEVPPLGIHVTENLGFRDKTGGK